MLNVFLLHPFQQFEVFDRIQRIVTALLKVLDHSALFTDEPIAFVYEAARFGKKRQSIGQTQIHPCGTPKVRSAFQLPNAGRDAYDFHGL